ncbi:MAG: alpha/beta hydrolase [Planctomycetota bacterium]
MTGSGRSRLLTIVIKIVIAAAVLYLAAAVVLYFLQDKLIFPAPRGGVRDPADAGLSAAESLEIVSSDNTKLHGYLLFPHGAARKDLPALLLFHGNGENVTFDASWLELLRTSGAAVAEVDYRGYGLSEGAPSEKGFFEDGWAALAALRARPEMDTNKIVLLGSSIGAAVAVFVASKAEAEGRPVAGVILQSPFDTLPNVAMKHYPVFPRFIVKYQFDSLSRIGSLKTPSLFLHGSADTIVPVSHARALHSAAPAARPFLLIEGAGHNDLISVAGDRYMHAIREFVHEVTRNSSTVPR